MVEEIKEQVLGEREYKQVHHLVSGNKVIGNDRPISKSQILIQDLKNTVG